MATDALARWWASAEPRLWLLDEAGPRALASAAMTEPLRHAARLTGRKLRIEAVDLEGAQRDLGGVCQDAAAFPVLLADARSVEPNAAQIEQLCARLSAAPLLAAVGAAAIWLARGGLFDGRRVALPWDAHWEADQLADRAILAPNLYEAATERMSCCGGAATLDFSLHLVARLCGPETEAQVKEALFVDRVREPGERQRVALQARFGGLQPKLTQAVALMEANLEEPLTADDIAGVVGISRRQLERLFKQYLNSVPSRYYLELRLQRARKLLLETSHSIVQVGLMCGFSSGSHFSTAYGALFGVTPREERQRKLVSASS
ncbi:HTH-type transcriptional regulator CdhR [Myxococcaceae bacterium]|nr:HTH-type transcriptional regulator CdhR [Myxococcaceae bacterium]